MCEARFHENLCKFYCLTLYNIFRRRFADVFFHCMIVLQKINMNYYSCKRLKTVHIYRNKSAAAVTKRSHFSP